MEFDLIGPFNFLKDLWGARLDSWNWISHVTYVLLAKNSQPQDVAQKINNLVKKQAPTLKNFNVHLQKITRIHLYSTFENEHAHRGNILYVYVFSLIALFIIFIACINFINLTTARATNRAREIGIRKVVGAKKQDLVRQFYIESILFSLIALMISIFLVVLFIPHFNHLTGKQITFNVSGDLGLLLVLVGIAIFASIICGSYPSLLLSSFKPVKILRGTLFSKGKRTPLRKVLVVSQFTISIFLIISTLVVLKQLKYIKNRNLGYDRQNILCFKAPRILLNRLSIIKQELYKNPDIIGATVSNTLPGRRETTSSTWDWEGRNTDERLVMEVIHVDFDYFKTFNMKLAAGRFLSKEHKTDILEGFILNEAAVEALGYKNQSPIGKRFTYKKRKSGRIIGVVKNFHSRSLRYKIGPVVMTISFWGDYDQFCLRIKSNNFSRTVSYIEKVWTKHVSNYPFQFKFFDETIEGHYRAEQKMGKVFNYFTFLAIFISCLGLLGLASYMTAQKIKEIGIRKVLGSSVSGIITLLSKNFILWVLLANIIAWPAAYFLMERWLQNFAYRTTIDLWVFILSGFIAMTIALITVSFQSIKAAYANPVDTLRYE
jgi:putative ABC transport system permease protein